MVDVQSKAQKRIKQKANACEMIAVVEELKEHQTDEEDFPHDENDGKKMQSKALNGGEWCVNHQ